jgi:uncharacterized protein DUF3147
MEVRLNFSAFRQTKWHEYAIRFLFGGAISVIAGIVASRFGPGLGGIFLAFPAILPASATLLEKHERVRKQRKGLSGNLRGRMVVAVDASGAALGGIGLLSFAFLSWMLMPRLRLWLVLVAASAMWFVVSSILWRVRNVPKRLWRKYRKRAGSAHVL